MTTQLLGWGGSVLLIFTITAQILRQWNEGSSKGVSPWLYIGQFSASTALLVYSVLLDEWVFIVLNTVMALAALVGLLIWRKFARASAGTKDAPCRDMPDLPNRAR